MSEPDARDSVAEIVLGHSAEVHIEGYQLLDVIGEGGMGTVYKAVDLNRQRPVALKVVNPALLSDPDIMMRFEREIRAAAILNHPNIVCVHDAGESNGWHYLAMEYVEGIDLEQLVGQAGYLAVARACDYIRQAALGLEHAHEHGIVHRDIKPPNLIVSRTDGVVKILDMGLARLLDPTTSEHSALRTHAGAFLGTADFVAPEQALDARHADHRADIYSLGCTLYYLLTGAVPFPGGTVLEKLDRHGWDTPIPVTALRPEIPTAVGNVVAKLMAKRPEARYPSAGIAASALAAFSTPSGVLAANAATPTTATGSDLSPLDEVPLSPLPADPAAIGEWGCWKGHTASVVGVAFTPDCRQVFSAGQDGVVLCWDVATGNEVARWNACRQGLIGMAVGPTGRRVVAAGMDRVVRVWDAEAGMEIFAWPDTVHNIRSLALSGNGRYLLTGMDDGTVRLWYAGSAKEVRRFEGHKDAVLCVAFSQDSSRFISGGEDHSLRLWDINSGRELRPGGEWFAEARRAPVNTIALSPHGRRAVSGGAEHGLYLWDVRTGRRLAKFDGHRGWIYSAVFAPNGRQLLSASGDKTVRFWDINSRRELICFTGHNDRVTSVALSPDARLAVSGGLDKTVRLWRFPT